MVNLIVPFYQSVVFRCATLTEAVRSLGAEKMAMSSMHEQVFQASFYKLNGKMKFTYDVH